MTKFCANLSFMFTERPFLERYLLARIAGFKAVESGFPFGFSEEDVVKAKSEAGIKQILINTYTGDVQKGELGFAAIPGKEVDFRESIAKTISYAKSLEIPKIHVMSGLAKDPSSENDLCYESNLRYAVEQFEKENIVGLIEPINNYSVPHYYMNSFTVALDIVKKINSPSLRLMLDIFHMQQIVGNLTRNISDLLEYSGHVQVAQVPLRHEPDSEGEINYPFIIDWLRTEGYTDWIGLEYKPLHDTSEGLKWITNYGFSL